MTPTPCIAIELISLRMASTAAPSPPSLSPRPTQRPAASAAASVTRTRSRARLRSSSSRLRTVSIRRSWHELVSSARIQWVLCRLCDDREVSAPSIPTPPVRAKRPGRDMALSLAVLLIPVFVLVGLYKVVFSGDAPIPVKAADTWASARHDAHLPVLEPQGLPAKWTVITATFAGGTLRVGYVTPSGAGVQLVESDRAADQLLPAELGADAKPGNLAAIGGRQWRGGPPPRDRGRALVQGDAGPTPLVVGPPPPGEPRTLLAAPPPP